MGLLIPLTIVLAFAAIGTYAVRVFVGRRKLAHQEIRVRVKR